MYDHEKAWVLQRTIDQKIKGKWHVHRPGIRGASGVMKGIWDEVQTFAGIKRPQKMGFGGMESGDGVHGAVQAKWEKYFGSPGWMAANPGKYYGSEIYPREPVQIGLYQFESPYDGSLVTLPPERVRMPHFDYTIYSTGEVIEAWGLQMAEGAEFLAIWDIKSAGDYAFKKYKRIKEDGDELDDVYKGQMHIYMNMAGLEEMSVFFVAKADYDQFFTISVFWDEQFWQRLIKRSNRKFKLVKAMEAGKDVTRFLKEYDLDWFRYDEDFSCRYCKSSVVKMEFSKWSGKENPVLEFPCSPAQAIQEKIGFPFVKGQQWKQGRYTVTIDSIVGQKVMFHAGKAGKPQVRTQYWCLKNLDAII